MLDKVRKMVGLIPLFASAAFGPDIIENGFDAVALRSHLPGALP